MSNVPDEANSEEIRSAIKIDGDAVRGHLDELVRSTVEETLNQMLDAEAGPAVDRPAASSETCGSRPPEARGDRIARGDLRMIEPLATEWPPPPHADLGKPARGNLLLAVEPFAR